MPTISTIIRQRRESRQHVHRSFTQSVLRFSLGIGILISTLFMLAILTGAWYYIRLTSDLPSVELLPLLLNPIDGQLLQPTRLYDRTGQQLLRSIAPDDADRTFQKYENIPTVLVNATLALADPGFWDHAGYTLDDWQDPERHSTLAQKLVSDLLLFDEPKSIQRAIRERLLAGQITAQFGRQQVIEWYLNSANYGHESYGIEAAAQFYFGISTPDLDLNQAALLAAISQAPALNPVDSPQAADQRRLETLQIMQAFRLVDASQVALAGDNPPQLNPARITRTDFAPVFTNLALAQLGEQFNRDRIERGGLIILTTLDYDLQVQADCSLQIQLIRLGAQLEPLVNDCPASNFLLPLQPGTIPGDFSASAMILDTKNGQILAIAGQGGVTHPAGTLLSPFIYLTGFTRGLSPSSLGWDIPGEQPELDHVYQGPVSLRTALVNDYLGLAYQVETQMGADNIWSIAQSFGLQGSSKSLLDADISVSMQTVAGAYATLANQGILSGQVFRSGKPQPYTVIQLTGVDNTLWGDWSFPNRQAVVSPALAFLINDVLSDETARNFNPGQTNPFGIGRPTGFKIGQTLDGSATWVVGYTPQMLGLVWMGSTETQSTRTSPLPAAGLWRALMQYSLQNLPPDDWAIPPDILHLNVCDPSGMLPSPACPNIVNEVFLSGSQPLNNDSLYQVFQVNKETGFLATVFTPSELVTNRVFMNVPPIAESWALSAGIQTPPTQYDTILQPSPLADVHISSPGLFADVSGNIQITGSAAGADFSYYRLEYGLGLDPQAWFQIGKDVTSPVEEGLLATWDSSGVNGLVALRLLVVQSDHSVKMAVGQLAVDNTPPEIDVITPRSGQEFSMSQEPGLVFESEVSDSYLLNVKMYVDNDLLADFSSAPFSLVWQPRQGGHFLRVLATDRAGNQTEEIILFSVKR
ncbi:MAG: transglycosylase domain-containing protein [Chloroflexota bacterium]